MALLSYKSVFLVRKLLVRFNISVWIWSKQDYLNFQLYEEVHY